MATVSLYPNQTVVARISPVDESGAARSVSNISWAVTSGDATVTPAEDGLSATITPGAGGPDGAPVESVITVTADSDLSEAGVNELSDTIEVSVFEIPVAQATNLGLTLDEPTTNA